MQCNGVTLHRCQTGAARKKAEKKKTQTGAPCFGAPVYAGSGGRDMGARGGRTTEPLDKHLRAVNVPRGAKNTEMLSVDVVALKFL